MASISTFRDNFDDTTVSSSLWFTFDDSPVTFLQSGGQLSINIPATANNDYAGYSSQINYDLTNSSILIEVPQTAQGRHAETYFDLFNSTGTGEMYVIQFGNFIQFHNGTNSNYTNDTFTYNAVNHRWWRIRHSGSTVYFDTSPDGNTWTNRSSDSTRFAITSMGVNLNAGVYDTADSATSAVFDNLNYSTASRIITETISGGGAVTLVSETAAYDISSRISGGGLVPYITEFQPLPQKDYEYRVYDQDWNFVSIWQKVTSDFAYDQSINQTASELTVNLARSPDNRVVTYDALKDQNGNNILDQNSQIIYVQTETANAIGLGTDVQVNYNVNVYAFYGGYEALLDPNGNIISDPNNDPIYVQYGAPNGKRVYSGYIVKPKLRFGSNMGVSVTVVPHATEMSHHVFKDPTDNTTVSYNSADPVQMARDAMDDYNSEGGIITYDALSMPLSGSVSSYDFKLQTTKEVQDKVIDLLPAGYYHYPHPGENKQYLLPKHETPDHVFYYEKHLSDIEIEQSITQLINDVYFVGGVPEGSPDGTPPLFKHYEDTTSQSTLRRGLERLSDSRVTLDTSAQALSQSRINQYNGIRYTTSITITDAVYDIETIKPGDMIGFKNFGSFIDDLVLQNVTEHRKKHEVTLDLDMIVYGDSKRLEEIKRNILSEQVREIADAPA